MLIGIDGNEANGSHRVGIGEYAYELLMRFGNFKYPISNIQFQIYLKDKPRADLPKESENWKYRIIGPKKLWTQFALPIDLYFHKPKPAVFFTPSHYAPRFSKIPTVISIMDLSYIYFPHLFNKKDLYQLRLWSSYSTRNARRICTISNASKNDIIKEYKVPESRVIVIYPGIKLKTQMLKVKTITQNSKLKEKYHISKDYILFVGTLQPRKNIIRLIEAFHKVKSNQLELVVAGKKGWLYEEILQAPKKFHVESSVRFLEFVSDEDLSILYQNAFCFVLPSLYEGFGLPVLEAMSHGCPVITSNVSSLPEAGGDAALYVDPMDVADIASKIQNVLHDDKLRKAMIEKGYKQVKKFSWEKTAKETLRVLEQVARGA